jgi:hypothetical protein
MVVPTLGEEQEGGQEEQELYDDIENLEYEDIAGQAEVEDLGKDYKCQFNLILAQDIDYAVGVNVEIDDPTLVLDPTYVEMDGTNPFGTINITTSELMNMYQQYYVLNTTNTLEDQIIDTANQQYDEGMEAINEQEEYINSNADLVYQYVYDNSLYEDEMLIEDGMFISDALNFDDMVGGSYFLNKFKKTNKTVN